MTLSGAPAANQLAVANPWAMVPSLGNLDAYISAANRLPLLTQEEYFTNLQYGYARGGAPVHFVESIRTYYRILEKYEQKHVPILPGFELVSSDFWQAAGIR